MCAWVAGALLATGLLTGCHSEGNILLELSQDGAPTANVASLQADTDSLYFLEIHGDQELMKLPKAGGTPRSIATDVAEYVITGDAIVFLGDGGALFDMPSEGGPRRSLAPGGVLRESLAATADKVYWVEMPGGDGPSIMSMPRDASQAPEVLVTGESKPRSMRVDAAGNVFWTTIPFQDGDRRSPSQLRMLPAGGGKPVTVVESSDDNHEIEIIVVDDTYVYTDAEPLELHRVPRAGGKSEVIARLEQRTQLTLFDGTLYGYEPPEGRILSMPPAGGDLNEIAAGHPDSIAVDDGYVYWANGIFARGGEDDPGGQEVYPASIARASR